MSILINTVVLLYMAEIWNKIKHVGVPIAIE
jgi:hypothetical protein